jgi:hypothetical protein
VPTKPFSLRLVVTLIAASAACFTFSASGAEPVATGKFAPTWESLKQYEVPEWFRDAKFGIWAHWVPQCQPEQGDWYARFMHIWSRGAEAATIDSAPTSAALGDAPAVFKVTLR